MKGEMIMEGTPFRMEDLTISDIQKKVFLRKIAKGAEAHFKNPENQRRFQEWLQKRKEK